MIEGWLHQCAGLVGRRQSLTSIIHNNLNIVCNEMTS
ncbi:hypothetical protein QFZ28_002223 [Neobacillus niacini]|nr:hypothetical protein [Neobacillus niacini]